MALTIRQPWATLVAWGEKKVETRGWVTRETGRIAIHSKKAWTPTDRAKLALEPFKSALARLGIFESSQLPLGMILGTVELVKTAPITPELVAKLTPKEIAFGIYEPFEPQRFAWGLRDARPLRNRIPLRGYEKLWRLPREVSDALEAGLRYELGRGETVCRHCGDPNRGGHAGEPCPSLAEAIKKAATIEQLRDATDNVMREVSS